MSRSYLRPFFVFAAVATMAALPLSADDLLFPKPLHLTRRIHESIGGGTTTVEQYCYGNRVITVSGSVTNIADYDKSEITEIDRSAGTYSVSRFDQVAKAMHPKALPEASAAKTKQNWELRKLGRVGALSVRTTEVYETERKDVDVTRHVRVGIDTSVALSKDALEVLTGSAFPGTPKEEDAAILAAAKGRAPAIASNAANAKTVVSYGLPVEQVFRFEAEGQTAEYRDVVTRVGEEIPPADLVAIPPDAKLVESRLIKTTRLLDAIDRLPLDGLKTTP